MIETIDRDWIVANPDCALVMIDRLMAERDRAVAIAGAVAAGFVAAWQRSGEHR